MIFGKTNKKERELRIERYKQQCSPRVWFAWRPVKIYLDGRWVWGEKVIKTKVIPGHLVTYETILKKPKKNKSDQALDLLPDFVIKELGKWMWEELLPAMERRDKFLRERIERLYNVKYEDF